MSPTASERDHRGSPNRSINRTTQTADDLRLELGALQAAIIEQERRDLKSAVVTENDFAARLRQIERAYKETRFDSYLRSAARHLHGYLRQIDKHETYEYWKARTLLYELNDVFQISDEINERTAIDGQSILEELRLRSVRWDKGSDPKPDDRRILREKVLLCACRGNELRRSGETTLALSLFEWLMSFTVNKLSTATFPCYGIRAALCYHMGDTLQAMEQHDRAEAMYSEALDLLHSLANKLGASDHSYVTRKQAMVVGLGFGWINMTRGFLARAEQALTTARSMLAYVNDPMLSSCVELVFGTIQRCRAGSNKTKLDAVISQLQVTRRAFMGHPRYQARTCWELALAKTLAGDIAGAQKDLQFVVDYADRTSNQKWQVNAQILQSRIYRKQARIEDALALAELAVDKARSPDCKSVLALMDAYINRGEAYLSLSDTTKSETHYLTARGNFEIALQCTLERRPEAGKADYFSNPKIAAVCNLRIAQCYVRAGKQTNAKKHFAIWLRLEPHVEHEWVRELSDRVRAEIDKPSMDFTISAYDPHEWSYSENVARLRRWLLAQSLRLANQNYSEAAKLIGVQRSTLYQWQTQEEARKRHRARTSSRESTRL
ncbi:MAG: hypothetical protein QOH41_726 [Blastocatellia bacterium]|jgi:tetratricopeptide (TPR) repeat protein|nr:hypothetical protein [Blastocatellia bacterium]